MSRSARCSSSGATRFVPFYRRSAFTIESAIYMHPRAFVLMYEHRPSIKLRGRANHFSRAMPSKSVSPRVISLLHAHNRYIDKSWPPTVSIEDPREFRHNGRLCWKRTHTPIDVLLLNFDARLRKRI